MAKVKKPARQSQSPFAHKKMVRCLGFGDYHEFPSTHEGHRRCPKCEEKFKALHVSQACEVPHKSLEG